jgi:hypothetical protein
VFKNSENESNGSIHKKEIKVTMDGKISIESQNPNDDK